METWPANEAFWKELAFAAHSFFQEALIDKRKLKYYIFFRAKEIVSVRNSIARQEKERNNQGQPSFASKDEILKAILDFVGVRILLSFPSGVSEVKAFLQEQSGDENIEAVFWGFDENGRVVGNNHGRFVEYRATHFRVKWRQSSRGYISASLTKPLHDGQTVEI